jgi:hypothetical protein
MADLAFLPPDFVWGAATSSYQVEGGWNEDGKGASIWDTFAHTPGKIANDENGDVVLDPIHAEDLLGRFIRCGRSSPARGCYAMLGA